MEGHYRFFCNYFKKIGEEEACIVNEIAQQKEVEKQINQKLAWYASLDEKIQNKMRQIKRLELWVDRHIDQWCTEINPVQITNGFFPLYGKDVQTQVRPDRKRCQKNLIKKGVMDLEYLEQVQEELMISKKYSGMTSCGTQQINHLVESIGHRIQHGNNTRAHEKKIYQEIKTVKETREIYSEPEPEPPSRYRKSHPRLKERDLKGDKDWKLSKQHRINICLDDIEFLKRHLKGRKSKVTRLKENLELVKRNISSLNTALENVKLKENEAYKRADNFGDQAEYMVEYQSIITYAEKLARKGVEGLKRHCMRDTQVEMFVRLHCSSNIREFRYDNKARTPELWMVTSQRQDDYETRKLASMSQSQLFMTF